MAGKFLKVTTDGIKQNIVPGIILWVIALALVMGYYFFAPLKQVFEEISAVKERFSFLFSALATILFAGIIPFLYLWFSGKIPKEHMVGDLLFFILFWGWKGIEVDLLYRLQGIMFGTVPGFETILKKTLFDQFVYNPFWGAPFMTIAYLFRDYRFSFKELKPHLKKELFLFHIPTLLISTWVVWIPAVTIIYCFPMALQIPMFNLVVCFWALFLAIMGSVKKKHNPAEE